MKTENQERGVRGQGPGVVGQVLSDNERTHPFTLSPLHPFITAAAMALGLALFYRSTTMTLKVAGLTLFGALALVRPSFALAFVPLTVPIYIMPVWLTTIREGLRLPLHEVILLVTLAATVLRFSIFDFRFSIGRSVNRTAIIEFLRFYLPHILLVLAGVVAVLVALPNQGSDVQPRSAAFREFRWIIVEPLIFYALLRFSIFDFRFSIDRHSPLHPFTPSPLHPLMPVIVGFIAGGAAVGLLGIGQYYGYDLVQTIFLYQKQTYSGDTVVADGLLRVTSVYGHPNNVGLYLGRVWPLAATLLIFTGRTTNDERRTTKTSFFVLHRSSFVLALLSVLGSLLCIAGVIVSFSRGAWFGMGAALMVLTVGWLRLVRANRQQVVIALAVVALVVAALVGWSLALRNESGAGSTSARLLIWRESLQLIRRHPFGLGLDQFYYYHNPFFGHSLIAPSLRGTSEETAAHPHNLLLDIWLSVGPLGLLAFGWLLVRFARSVFAVVWRSPVTRPAALVVGATAAMSAALVHGGVDNFYFHVPDLAFSFWLLMALVETPADD